MECNSSHVDTEWWIQGLCCCARCTLHPAGLVPAAAPKPSPSMANSPSLEIWSIPNDKKGIHINWRDLWHICLQKEEKIPFLHGIFSLRTYISTNFYIINSVNHAKTPSPQCILWLQMKKHVYKSHILRCSLLQWDLFLQPAELPWPAVWPRLLWVTVPAGVRYSALLKNITWRNLVATSENLSSRDLCSSLQRRWGIGCFYLKPVVKCVYNHTGAAHLFPKEVIIQVSGEFYCSARKDELAQTIPSLDTNTKKLLGLFLLFPLIHR